MKNIIRKSWAAVVAALIVGLVALAAHAAFGPGQIATMMEVSPVSVKAGKSTNVVVHLVRLDNGKGVQSQAINIYVGDPTYPDERIGTRVYTDSNGKASCVLYGNAAWVGKDIVVLAEMEPNSYFAAPLPWALVTVKR